MENERAQLLERVKKAEEVANQCRAEAGVYRDLLDKCREAADNAREAANKAIEANSIAFVSEFISEIEKQTRWAANEGLVKELGRKLIYSYRGDKAWLSRTLQSLETIKAHAEKLTVEERSPNAEIKDEVLKAAKDGLIRQL